jgi:hypothetical protein
MAAAAVVVVVGGVSLGVIIKIIVLALKELAL